MKEVNTASHGGKGADICRVRESTLAPTPGPELGKKTGDFQRRLSVGAGAQKRLGERPGEVISRCAPS